MQYLPHPAPRMTNAGLAGRADSIFPAVAAARASAFYPDSNLLIPADRKPGRLIKLQNLE
jgi:hypothetical protein